MHSNQYTLIFTSVLTIILASLLSVAAGSLNQIQKLNVEIDSKKIYCHLSDLKNLVMKNGRQMKF